MLTRRTFGAGILSTSALAPFMAPAPARGETAGTKPISSVQLELRLEVTLGSLIGAALGSALYLSFARQAPPGLVAAFSEALILSTGVQSLKRPTSDYIEMRFELADRQPERAQSHIRNDVNADTVAFRELSAAVRAQSIALDEIRNSSRSSVREFRETLDILRREIEVVRLERERASASTSSYVVAGDELHRTRLIGSNKAEEELKACIAESERLRSYTADLEDIITRRG